jgi:hypothetical protein
MKKKLFLFSILLVAQNAMSQVGIGTSLPESSAMLDVSASDKGILFPRLTTVQRIGIPAPASGLHVFDVTTKSLWFFNGNFWINYASQAKVGDVKSGIQPSDHEGWVLLDGRLISSMSASQQSAATAMGLSGNLPNASNAYLVQNGGGMGAVSGANTTTLAQTNLPNVNFTGTAASAGDHAHVTDPASVSSTSNGDHNHTTDPASVSSSADGNHAHSTDPSAVWSSTDGYHAHNLNMVSKDDGNFSNQPGQYPTGDANYGYGSNHFIATEGNGNHAHTVDIPATTSTTNGNHSHTVDVPSTTSSSTGTHAHSVDISATTSTTTGAHAHSVSVASGGSATPINIAPKSLSVNMFIYLGL